MFKYTPPWQVLCQSLDHDNKRLSGGYRKDALTLQSSQTSQSSLRLPLSEAPPSSTMEGIKRTWVMKPLSPLLQPSDLRTITTPSRRSAPDLDNPVFGYDSISITHSQSVVVSSQGDKSSKVVVQVQQVAESQDGSSTSDERYPSSPSSPSSSTGSQSGFYSFVDDPTSPEAELNEAWMISPQRQSKLATLKKEKGFKLQTYSSGKKPESLFSESNGDSQYKMGPNNGIVVVRKEEEKQLRNEIIRSQAPKKSQTVKHDLEVDPRESTGTLIEGFSLSYSPVTSMKDLTRLDETDAIDKQQINFSAARQQFLKIEQDRLSSLLTPPRSSKASLNKSGLSKPEGSSEQLVTYRVEVDGDTQRFRPAAEVDEEGFLQRRVTVNRTEDSLSRQSSVLDDLDSGLEELSLEVGGGYTSDENMFSDKIPDAYETPIQREIRLAQEREENLRRSRGMKLIDSGGEIIEIKTKRLQSPQTPLRTKEKNRVSFVFQREIQKESQRRNEPQQPGGYLDQKSLYPPLQQGSRGLDQRDEVEGSKPRPLFEPRDTEVLPSPCCPHRHTEETEFYISQTSSTPSFFSARDRTASSSSHSSSSRSSPIPAYLRDMTITTPQSSKGSLESTGLPYRGKGAPEFLEKEIQEALRREQELRDLRESRGESRWEVNSQAFSPAPLVDQTTKTTVSHFYPPLKTDKTTKLSSSSPGPLTRKSFITAQPWTYSHLPSTSSPRPVSFSTHSVPSSARPVSLSSHPVPSSPDPVFFDPHPVPYSSYSPAGLRQAPLPVRGLAETLLQDYEERRLQLKLEESAYAGIQPIDDINNEVVESTRVIRHKNTRTLRWEAGVYSNQEDD